MNECWKYWLRINKIHLIIDCCGAAVFTALGGGRLISVIFYVISVEICGMNYLGVLRFPGSDSDSLSVVKALRAERRVFYDTYIKAMLLQTAVFAAVFALGTWMGSVIGVDLPFIPQAIFRNGTAVSNIGYYTFLIAIVMIVIVVMVGFTEKCTTLGRPVLMIGTVYLAIIFQLFYLLLLTLAKLSPRVGLIYSIFAASGFAALFIMTVVLAVKTNMNRKKFMTK